MGIFTKAADLFSGGIDKTIESAGKLVDNITTTDEEKQTLKNELAKIINDGFTTTANVVRDVTIADQTGNWLQRSWRPILLLLFGFVLLVNYTIFPMINRPAIDFPTEFWTFLEIIVPTAVVARSFDKSSGSLLKNIDLPFMKRRDRKVEPSNQTTS